MKLSNPSIAAGSFLSPARRTEHGMAVIVVLVLLSIILLYLAASARTLHLLGRELKQVEQQQVHRLAASGNGTNTSTATNTLTTLGGTQPHGADNSH